MAFSATFDKHVQVPSTCRSQNSFLVLVAVGHVHCREVGSGAQVCVSAGDGGNLKWGMLLFRHCTCTRGAEGAALGNQEGKSRISEPLFISQFPHLYNSFIIRDPLSYTGPWARAQGPPPWAACIRSPMMAWAGERHGPQWPAQGCNCQLISLLCSSDWGSHCKSH